MKIKPDILEGLTILIVITILGLITFNQFNLAAARSRDTDRMSSLHELSKAVRLYYKDYKKLPDAKLINSLWGKSWKDGDYTYLEVMPNENKLSKNFCYQNSIGGKSFIFFADLEDHTNADCKKDQWECGGVKYCYKQELEAEVAK